MVFWSKRKAAAAPATPARAKSAKDLINYNELTDEELDEKMQMMLDDLKFDQAKRDSVMALARPLKQAMLQGHKMMHKTERVKSRTNLRGPSPTTTKTVEEESPTKLQEVEQVLSGESSPGHRRMQRAANKAILAARFSDKSASSLTLGEDSSLASSAAPKPAPLLKKPSSFIESDFTSKVDYDVAMTKLERAMASSARLSAFQSGEQLVGGVELGGGGGGGGGAAADVADASPTEVAAEKEAPPSAEAAADSPPPRPGSLARQPTFIASGFTTKAEYDAWKAKEEGSSTEQPEEDGEGEGEGEGEEEEEEEELPMMDPAEARAKVEGLFETLLGSPSVEDIAQISEMDPIVNAQFLLLGGLDALSRPLAKRAAAAAPPSEEADVAVMSEVIKQLTFLLNSEDFAMTVMTRPHSDVEELRDTLGVEPLSESVQALFQPTDHAMLRALVLSIDPKRPSKANAEIRMMPPLIAVAALSPEAHEVLLQQFESVSGEGGSSEKRLQRLVDMCKPPPASATEEERAASLGVIAHALGVLNELISSPAKLDTRMALRSECETLGLSGYIETLAAAAAAAAAASSSGSAAEEEEGGSSMPKSLIAQLEVYQEEAEADAREKRIELNPLEEFKGCCVVLYTSISVQQLQLDRWKHVEAIMAMKEVGYVGVDAAIPERKKAREALWEVSGHKDYPQVFCDNRYMGGEAEIQKMIEEDAAREQRIQMMMVRSGSAEERINANFGARKVPQLPKGVGFHSTFAEWIGKEGIKEDKTLSYQ